MPTIPLLPLPAGTIARALRAVALATAVGLAACTPFGPQRAGIATDWRPSPNFDARSVSLVVIHYTAVDTAATALRTLTSPSSRVSAHYLVERGGNIVQLVDERARAWHAGDSRWGPIDDVNSASIGVELDNDGREPYPPAQIAALVRLLADLRDRHGLGAASFVGHADVAPARKSDPGPLFPWRTLGVQGFGLWCEPPWPPAPPGFDALLGLSAIGYDLRQPEAAVRAFRTRFTPEAIDDAPVERDRDLIACLAQASIAR